MLGPSQPLPRTIWYSLRRKPSLRLFWRVTVIRIRARFLGSHCRLLLPQLLTSQVHAQKCHREWCRAPEEARFEQPDHCIHFRPKTYHFRPRLPSDAPAVLPLAVPSLRVLSVAPQLQPQCPRIRQHCAWFQKRHQDRDSRVLRGAVHQSHLPVAESVF